jgi:hypothetical protein
VATTNLDQHDIFGRQPEEKALLEQMILLPTLEGRIIAVGPISLDSGMRAFVLPKGEPNNSVSMGLEQCCVISITDAEAGVEAWWASHRAQGRAVIQRSARERKDDKPGDDNDKMSWGGEGCPSLKRGRNDVRSNLMIKSGIGKQPLSYAGEGGVFIPTSFYQFIKSAPEAAAAAFPHRQRLDKARYIVLVGQHRTLTPASLPEWYTVVVSWPSGSGSLIKVTYMQSGLKACPKKELDSLLEPVLRFLRAACAERKSALRGGALTISQHPVEPHARTGNSGLHAVFNALHMVLGPTHGTVQLAVFIGRCRALAEQMQQELTPSDGV